MSELTKCAICGRSVDQNLTYLCLDCGRRFCSDCMIDSITVCPDCKDS